MGLGTKTNRPGIALSNSWTTLNGKDEAVARRKGTGRLELRSTRLAVYLGFKISLMLI